MVKRIFHKLRSLSQARSKLQNPDYRTLHDPTTQPGFLERVFSDVFAPDRRPVADVEHRAGGASLGGLLKSGIGLLGVSVGAKKHPRENPALWVYVVGGVTADEASALRELVAERSEGRCQLVVGGTSLLGPREAVEAVLASDPLREEML